VRRREAARGLDDGDEANGRSSVLRHYVFVVTEGGYAKRTRVEDYRKQQRGGLGIKVAKLSEDRGDLAARSSSAASDEVLVVLASGKVVRSDVAEVPAKGRDTMGVVFAKFADDDRSSPSRRTFRTESRGATAAESEAAEPAGRRVTMMSSVAEKLAARSQRRSPASRSPAARLHRLLVGGEAVVPRRRRFAVVSIVVTFLIYTVLELDRHLRAGQRARARMSPARARPHGGARRSATSWASPSSRAAEPRRDHRARCDPGACSTTSA
jgi:hypothetical protein